MMGPREGISNSYAVYTNQLDVLKNNNNYNCDTGQGYLQPKTLNNKTCIMVKIIYELNVFYFLLIQVHYQTILIVL